MASVLTKNSGLSGRYKFDVLNGTIQQLPGDVTAGCATQLTLSATAGVPQSMTIATSATFNATGLQVGGKFTAVTPFNPCFTVSSATVTFNYVIEGWDHFGDAIQEVGGKTSTTVTVARTWRVFSSIKSIVITRTDAGGGTPTLDCGTNSVVEIGTANTPWVRALPFKVSTSQVLGGCQLVGLGAWTAPANWALMVSKAVVGGAGLANQADTAFTSNNPYNWTPNRLAREGLAVVLSNGYTVAAGATPTWRWFWTRDAVEGT
jgi:hypothetical protein